MRLLILTPESFSLIDEPICLIDDMPNLMREPMRLIVEMDEPHR
jgi:hypothetical protein